MKNFYADFSDKDDLSVAKNFLLNILAKITAEILAMDSTCDNSDQIDSLATTAMNLTATLHSLRYPPEYNEESESEECSEE